MNVHFIIHETYEGPGALLQWAENQNYIISSTKIYLEEALPLDNSAIDLLIVLGGPQCPATTPEECHYFKAPEEISFILDCIQRGKAVLGVCLGAQLMGEALGAKFEQSPQKEIGYFPIKLTESGRENHNFSHFNALETVGHWHNDMPGLTSTSRVLATSAGCPRQIVEYSPLVYGFQCHLEFTAESVTELIAVSADEFEDIGHHNYIQNPERLMANNSLSMNSLLFEFMDKLMVCYAKNSLERIA
jgi:GMP synthase (glutamine-hydrolysing)